MTLVDTSVWIDHLRSGNRNLTDLLEADEVFVHPFVIGELACGNLQNRAEILNLLRALPQVTKAADEEVLQLIGGRNLQGKGLGLIDVHLLASCLMERCYLLTKDTRLAAVAADMGLGGGSQRSAAQNR